jgi:hypothetical protein
MTLHTLETPSTGSSGASGAVERARRARRAVPGGADAILCAACGHAVTTPGARFVHGGRRQHTQVNPHGYLFTLGTWREAPGARVVGPPSSQWSWFPGYTWQIAECAGCGGHLGWRFRSGDDAFWGLVLDRLVEPAGDPEDPTAPTS